MSRFAQIFRVFLVGCAFVATASQAAGAGDEVVVIYNSRMSGSEEVARHYAKLREVPDRQVIGFALPTSEDMSRAEFRDKLQKPLARKLEDLKLLRFGEVTAPATNGRPKKTYTATVEAKVRYAVLCYGVPLRVTADNSLVEDRAASLRPELKRNEAAVDNELAWLPSMRQEPLLAGPLGNPVYGATNRALFHPTNGVLLVARIDGPTPAIAKGLVDKAIQAEREGLWGRAYFDVRGVTEEGLKPGDQWIGNAAEIAKQLGFETTVHDGPGIFPASFPMSQIGLYAGWYTEHVSGPFAQRRVEFMPGAFAYHLHSWSAATLRDTNRHWVAPLLGKGVTATMGSVHEPYLAGTPDIGVFFARFIFHGFSFGEAAYASLTTLSWQTTVVGDPLYRPFAKSPQQLHAELERENNPLAAWSHLRVVNLNLARNTPPDQLVTYLNNAELTKKSAVLMEKLGDLFTRLGKPASARHAYEQALKLDASPMQKARLRLGLGEDYLAAGETEPAFTHLSALLEGWPDYPDALSIYRKLLPLAQKLEKKDAVAKIEAEIKRLSPPKS